MIPERENPQDGSAWTKIDGGWRRGLGRTLIDPSGVIREQAIFFGSSSERIQQDILPEGNVVRVATTETAPVLEGALNNNPEDAALEPFVKMLEAHIRINDYNTKTSLTIFESPDENGEYKKRIAFTKGILDADETAFYFNFGRYCAVEGDVFYREGNIDFMKIESKIDNPGGGPVRVHQDIRMESIAPEITVSFGDNDQASFITGDAIEGWLGRGQLEFSSVSEDKKVSNVFRLLFGNLGSKSLECQVRDEGDKFTLELTDPTTKKTIRVSAAKKVDFDSLCSTASTPEPIGWEKAIRDVDKYFSVGIS